MKRLGTTMCLLLLVCGMPAAIPAAEQTQLLWQIGTRDGDTADLALGPRDFSKYGEDPMFVVGVSEAKRDWPYVHPGPADLWAGSRAHTFTVVFGLKEKPAAGQFRLLADFADTHYQHPPQLEVRVNDGPAIVYKAPVGKSDDSIHGNPKAGRPAHMALAIPAAQLAAGSNAITIENRAGSWVLYDWVGFEAPAGTELAAVGGATLIGSIRSSNELVEGDGKPMQTIAMTVRHAGSETEAEVVVQPLGAAVAAGGPPTPRTSAGEPPTPRKVKLLPGPQTITLAMEPVTAETPLTIELRAGGKSLGTRQVVVRPVRKWTVYLLPHSHVDIGYTHVQDEVERRQWANLERAMDIADQTAANPAGARFKWNSEVLWAVDSYLRKAPADKQQRLIEAVRAGKVELDGLYGNELTALCRPEELLRLLEAGVRLARRTGVPVQSAMISDVPGYTWGIVPAMAQAGIKYFSIGPNFADRIGWTMAVWTDKPFYWLSPDGRHKVLCWVPFMGYALGHTGYRLDQRLPERLAQLEKAGYPYDIVQLRWNVGGDNGPPDANLPQVVKNWNATHAYPRMVIATASEMFREFEKRYGDKVPVVRGDFTPYWEDGAASSARETALNRAAAERLSQAEALWAMTSPKTYPAEEFYAAWRNVILYDEHTWGAHCSINQPDNPFTKSQWAIKQAFAVDADKQSQKLLAEAAPFRSAALRRLSETPPAEAGTTKQPAEAGTTKTAVMVYNTTAWPRTELVIVSEKLSQGAKGVKQPNNVFAPSQRLSTGELAFLAIEVPALGARKFIFADPAPMDGTAKADGAKLSTSDLTVTVNEKTGGIASLTRQGIAGNLVNGKAGFGLNDYFYVLGSDVKGAKRNGPVQIKVKEQGPLVASLLVESDAPGCRKLVREVRVIDGLPRVDLIDTVDKEPIRVKEGVHFGYAFNVPQGVVRMDIPWAVVRPEEDQMPGACKNWFTVQRWVDVSNERCGVTMATIDAPLVEVGAITADRIGSQTDPKAWIEHLAPSQTLYSWVMNNHWHTNYKADQDGPTVFRYALRPHAGGYNGIETARFGIEQSQPLVAVPVAAEAPPAVPDWLKIESDGAIVGTLKPANDGKAIIVRLFGASGRPSKATISYRLGQTAGRPPVASAPKAVWLSNLAEEPQTKVTGPIEVPAMGIVTLRVELPE